MKKNNQSSNSQSLTHWFDIILKKLKKTNSHTQSFKNIPIQQETLLLRKYLIDQFKAPNKFALKNNLSKKQINCVQKYFQTKPFSIVNSDKNIGWVILKKELYNKLAIDHLILNSNVYKRLENNPLEETVVTIRNKLTDLNTNGHISNRLFKQLLPSSNNKLGKFRILVKLHKDKFGVRPIINSINHPTSNLSYFIDLFLQPYVQNSESYIKDSQNLIQHCNNLEIGKISHKYSCDFESLYTNIITSDAIDTITEYFSRLINNFDFDIVGFNSILKIVLLNNIFSFNNNFYLQKNGLAMGSKCGPTFANIYVYILEKKWLFIHKPLIYKRFIDDIFMTSNNEIDQNNFKSIFKNLNLNIIKGNKVQFLDLLISNNDYQDTLKFELYTKPTNTFQYLYFSSNHPKHIFNNIPKSLFIRLRRICSEYIDYLFFSRKLIIQLLKRGYKLTNLIKISLTIGNINRNNLIPYKDKLITNRFNNNVFKLIVNFDINYINLNKDFNHSSIHLKNNFNWLSEFKFTSINKSANNLNTIFVNKSFQNFYSKNSHFTKMCNNNCIACPMTYNYNFIRANSFMLPMLSQANCNSEYVIYILLCVKCNVYYIGQTGRKFITRFTEHLRNIKNFKAFIKINSEIATHFNIKGHNFTSDLKFCIFKTNVYLVNDRLSIEADLINIFISLNLKIINNIIPNLNKIKNLTFS